MTPLLILTEPVTVLKLTPIEELLILRRRKGWDQKETAKLLDVPLRTLRSWEQGQYTPTRIVLNAIQAFVDQHADEVARPGKKRTPRQARTLPKPA